MNKSKLLATVAAIGALGFSTLTMAAPCPYGQPQCPQNVNVAQKVQNIQEATTARYEAIARLVTLKADQKAAWDNYVAAAVKMHGPVKTWDKPAIDIQDRLERRAETSALRAQNVKAAAAARAELLKVLSPEQKMVLEQSEVRGMKAFGRKAGLKHHGMGPGMGAGNGPRMGQGMPCNPQCPLAK